MLTHVQAIQTGDGKFSCKICISIIGYLLNFHMTKNVVIVRQGWKKLMYPRSSQLFGVNSM